MAETIGEIHWGWAVGRVGTAPFPTFRSRGPVSAFLVSWVWGYEVIPSFLSTTTDMT